MGVESIHLLITQIKFILPNRKMKALETPRFAFGINRPICCQFMEFWYYLKTTVLKESELRFLHLLVLVNDLLPEPSGWSLVAANLIILYPAVYNDFFMGELDPLSFSKFIYLFLLAFVREDRGSRSI